MPKHTVTANDRVREFEGEGMYSPDKSTVFCRYCNCRISWDRRDTILKHVQSEKHKANKSKDSIAHTKRQATISGSFEVAKKKKRDCEYLARRTVETFLKANIPLHKLENDDFREWMNEFIEGAGDIPCVKTMRENIVPSIEKQRKEEVIQQLAGKDVVLLADETTDKRGRCIFAVLVKTVEALQEQKLFVASVQALETANSTQCARAILGVLQEYHIQYDNVKAIVSDSARYMIKCVNSLKTILGDNLSHVQCWAHKLILVSNVFSKELSNLNSAITNLKSAFLNTRKRKHLYLQFLKEKKRDPKLFPIPVLTRWNSWLSTATYVAQYFEDMVEFFRSDDMRDISNAGIDYINSLSADNINSVLLEAMFVKEHATDLIDISVYLESSKYPTSHELYSKLKQLESGFSIVADGVFGKEPNKTLHNVKKQTVQAEMKETLKRTGLHLQTRLTTLMATDPCKSIFSTLELCFNPKTVVINSVNSDMAKSLSCIPGMAALSNIDILKGYKSLQNLVGQQVSTGNVDIVKCLQATALDNPQFAAVALKAIWFPCSNVDSERLFSQYNEVLTDRRHNLSEENLELMTMISYEKLSSD